MACGWAYEEPPDPLEPSLRIALATEKWLETLEDPAASAERVASAKAWVDEETRRAFEDVARAQAVQARLEMLRRKTKRSPLRPVYRLPVRRSAARAPRRARRARHATQGVARGSPADDGGPETPGSDASDAGRAPLGGAR
jgi:hypothetical protein